MGYAQLFAAIWGLVTLVMGVVAGVMNRGHFSKTHTRRVQWGLLFCGVLLAAASAMASYQLGSRYKIVGFPFVVAVFERRANAWIDYVGPLSVPAFIGNACVGLLIPQVVYAGHRKLARLPASLKGLLLFLLLLASPAPGNAQKCDVDSGFRGGRFNVYYEQRHLVKVFRDFRALPPDIRTKLRAYLQEKLGGFAQRLEFNEGERLDLRRLKKQLPSVYEQNTKLRMYDLLFRFSNRSKGLRYYYTKMALNEDGPINQEIGLPNLRQAPSKSQIVSCSDAFDLAALHGFRRDHSSIEFRYSADRDAFVWTLWGDRIDDSPTGNSTYRKIDLDANTGEVLRVYAEAIAF